jgi:hypothetical protein
MHFSTLSAVFGIVGTVVGFAISILQWRLTKDATKIRREQLVVAINRAEHLIMIDALIGKILDKDNPHREEQIRQWFWSLQKGTYDLYVGAVSHYLSLEPRFTYKDLEYARRAGLVNGNWQEHLWRSLIAVRPENKRAGTAPPSFVPEDRAAWAVATPGVAAATAGAGGTSPVPGAVGPAPGPTP